MADDKKKGEEEGAKKEGEGAAANPKGSKRTLLLVVGGVVGLILLIGVPVAFFVLRPAEKPKTSEELAADAAQGEAALVPEGSNDEDELMEGEEPLGAFFPMETFVLNLDEGRFIRLQVQLEFFGPDISKRFYARTIPLRDALISLITGKKSEGLLSDKGKEDLRGEIRDRINEILRKEEVKKVYFTQFVIQ